MPFISLLFSILPTRERISLAALLVNVTAVIWRGSSPHFFYQMDYFFCDYPGFARAGARQDQKRAVEIVDGFLLSGVKCRHSGLVLLMAKKAMYYADSSVTINIYCSR